MDWQSVGQLSLDTLLDSLKVLAFAFAIYLLLSFFEEKKTKCSFDIAVDHFKKTIIVNKNSQYG